MEPRGAWAQLGEDVRIVVHAAHQSPYNLRNGMANGNFNIKPTDLRVLTADVGGSFGMKSGVQPEYALVAWAARKVGRPVRWVSDRTEGFLADEQAREMRITVELGLDAQHKFTALRLRWDVNLGAYVTGRSGWPVGNIGGTAGVYHIPTIYAESCGIMTNTVPTAAYRGAGRPEATYTIERIIDVAARELGISPYELRRINLIPPEAMPYKTALTFTYDCGEFEGNMRKAADMAELDSFERLRLQIDEASFHFGAGRLGLGDLQHACDEERPAVQILDHLEALLALADEMMRAIRPGDVAHDIGERAHAMHVDRRRLRHLSVPLQQDADLALIAHCLLRGRDRFRPAERDRQHETRKQHGVAHRHDDERIRRQRRHGGCARCSLI